MKELWKLFAAWFRIGLFTFGGGYAMLPMIRKEIIERYHWATDEEVMNYYAAAQCTPGAIAVNTATFIGYKQRKAAGGAAATLGVITPSIIILFLIASLLSGFEDVPAVQHALAGIRPAVCALMAVSVVDLMKKGLRGIPSWVIFALAFSLSCFTRISTVLLVLAAGSAGVAMSRVRRARGAAEDADDADGAEVADKAGRPERRRAR